MRQHDGDDALMLGAEAADLVMQVSTSCREGGQDCQEAVAQLKYLLPRNRALALDIDRLQLLLDSGEGEVTSESWQGLRAELQAQQLYFAVMKPDEDPDDEGDDEVLIAGSTVALAAAIWEHSFYFGTVQRQ